jgi:hypothetical protein
MTTPTAVRRLAARSISIALLAGAGVLATTHPAGAVGVSAAWDGGSDVTLSSSETGAAVADGIYASGSMCSAAITTAVQAGIYFSDWARSNCSTAVVACAKDAYAHNRALSGVRFYATRYTCLVR